MSALRIVTILLRTDAALAGIVGDRIYPVVAPQEAARPYIVASLIGEDDFHILTGSGGFWASRVEVQAIADSAAAVDALGETIKDVLGDVTARNVADGGSPPDFTALANVLKQGSDVTDYSDDRTVFRRIIDFSVHWRRAP